MDVVQVVLVRRVCVEQRPNRANLLDLAGELLRLAGEHRRVEVINHNFVCEKLYTRSTPQTLYPT